MSLAANREKNSKMATMMKQNPSQYPDSVRRPHNGCGSADRIAASKLG